MSKIFVDTSGWASLFDPKDKYHSQANAIYKTFREPGTRLITTNYIIAELAALLTSPLRISRNRIVNYIDGLRTSELVDLLHIDEFIENRAWKLFKNRDDKEWSLVDCSSFVLMTQYEITDALTNDHHFEQAGFVRLLK